MIRPLVIIECIPKHCSFFSAKANVVGTQENSLKETVLLSTKNILLKFMDKKTFTILRPKNVFINLNLCMMYIKQCYLSSAVLCLGQDFWGTQVFLYLNFRRTFTISGRHTKTFKILPVSVKLNSYPEIFVHF